MSRVEEFWRGMQFFFSVADEFLGVILLEHDYLLSSDSWSRSGFHCSGR